MADSADLLFELGTEELPPRALWQLSTALTAAFVAGLESADLHHGEVTGYATPRRLALLVRDCATHQPERLTQRRGPALQAAFDADGKPTKAAEGFARSCGVTVDQLVHETNDKGEWLSYTTTETGQSAAELLPAIAEQALSTLPIPKKMRWSDCDALFVRPVHWLVFLHGSDIVPCTLLEATAGRNTRGHRFHHPDPITITTPGEYATLLREEGYVIADFALRRQLIHQMVNDAAQALTGTPDLDDNLLDEVTALTEWPVPITGSFEERFLAIPHEALVLTMKQNQKYFPLFDAANQLMNHFITIANIDSPCPEVIKEGNERVIRPRLGDAMFFWQQDSRQRLEDHLEALKHVIFQKQLGSMYEKSQRTSNLAAQVANALGGDPGLARRAGMLSRCDLMTGMVCEFPEMQGIMGRYQAHRDGEADELAVAMDEFYMPRFSGDQLPQSKIGIAVALADRIDTLVGVFGIGHRPTGDRDPFALRRAAIGALRILREHAIAIELPDLLATAHAQLEERVTEENTTEEVHTFMLERLRGLYQEAGIDSTTFQAVAGVRPTQIADFEQRIQAVTLFRDLPEAEALTAANKRIRNILKKNEEILPGTVDKALLRERAEQYLSQRIETITQAVTPLFTERRYTEALKQLATLREPIDAFFDQVMVMADDAALRKNRLALLQQLSGLFLQAADISRLQR